MIDMNTTLKALKEQMVNDIRSTLTRMDVPFKKVRKSAFAVGNSVCIEAFRRGVVFYKIPIESFKIGLIAPDHIAGNAEEMSDLIHQVNRGDGLTRIDLYNYYVKKTNPMKRGRKPGYKLANWEAMAKWDWSKRDNHLSKEHSLTRERIRQIRKILGKPKFPRKQIDWNAVDFTNSDRENSRALVVSYHTVRYQRIKRGLGVHRKIKA